MRVARVRTIGGFLIRYCGMANITIKKTVTKIDRATEEIWVELGRQVLRLA